MKIAIISIVFPFPIDSGGSAGTFNLIDHSRKKHDITFLSPNVPEWKKEGLQKAWPNVRVLTTPKGSGESIYNKAYKFGLKLKQKLSGQKPDYFYSQTHLSVNDLSKFYSFGFLEMVQKEISENSYDLIQVEYIEFAAIVHLLPKDIPKIFIHHELRYKRLEMEYATLSHKTLEDKWHINATRDLEIALLNHYQKVVTVSVQDRQYLEDAGVKKELLITSPSPISMKSSEINKPFKFQKKLVFLGPEAHYPNLDAVNWFLENCWPQILKQNPDVKFQVISRWSDNFKKLHSKKKSIEFLGFVDDLDSVFEGAIMIVPLRIVSGMRMKILEGISWNVPIVSTADGAEGLPMKDGVNCMIANTPEDFVSKVNELIHSEDLVNTLIGNSEKLFLKDYQIENCGEIRNSIYRLFE